MIYRLVPSDWLREQGTKVVLEGMYTRAQIKEYNLQGYNVYYFPNRPRDEKSTLSRRKADPHNKFIQGSDIEVFKYVFVDMDLKDGHYATKEEFIEKLQSFELPPFSVVDSGGGVHAYWRVSDLTGIDFLRLQRRLCRYFHTDPAVAKLNQLMRLPGSLNVKKQDNYREVKILASNPRTATSEVLDRALPKIAREDEEYVERHWNSVMNPEGIELNVSEEIPLKFTKLMKENPAVKKLFYGPINDRSAADFKIGHLLYSSGYTKEEALSVLLNCEKALERNTYNRLAYASNIVDKIWVAEARGETPVELQPMARSVTDLLGATNTAIEHERIQGHELFDKTVHGFRLTEVWGIIGGSGIGKSAIALNQFKWFAQFNPQWIHLFVSLEMPANEIAQRWRNMCGNDTRLYSKVYIIDNYDAEGNFRNLGLKDIEQEVLALQVAAGKKVGCVVVDHVGVLNTPKAQGEYGGIQGVCEQMKPMAKTTNTFLIMLSQTSREKAGIGDIELDKDAAWGTSKFENYCDYVTTIWQPLKRVYKSMTEHKLTCIAYKFCKIRHKNVKKDRIEEDTVYAAFFDPDTETLRKLTDDEFEMYEYWNREATKRRTKDKKAEPSEINKTYWVVEEA